MNIDEEWNNYLMEQRAVSGINASFNSHIHNNSNNTEYQKTSSIPENIPENESKPDVPFCDELYISTNTKSLYLNQEIDVYDIFWNIPMIEYWQPISGVVYKNMKIKSTSREQFQAYQEKLKSIPFYQEHIIKQIDIVNSKKSKFKDERKIMIGISKKDIINTKQKKKTGAFMNCFSITLRFLYEGLFREIHVKIFKKGNLEIPGVLNIKMFDSVKQMIIELLQPHLKETLCFVEREGKSRDVLINSNFRCGFYVERDKFYTILRTKYGIDASYDPNIYPGVKCKFYFNHENGYNISLQEGKISIEDRNMTITELEKNKKYTEMTFTIFRTGSCLIAGNCSEDILFYIYDFLKKILRDEYYNICTNTKSRPESKLKKVKLRKRIVEMTPEYYQNIFQKQTSDDKVLIKFPC